MKKYAALILPSTNRVYTDTSLRLMRSEIEVANTAVLDTKIHEIGEATFGGVQYLVMTSDELAERDIAFLSNLSSLYALFEMRDGMLAPVAVTPLDKFASDLLTTQRYQGKTNEQFTKLLLNVTAFAAESTDKFLTGQLKVLDPLCGRGTTLNQAVMYGFDAAGLDVDAKDFDAYTLFFRTWLKNSRLKHQAEVTPIRREHVQLGRQLEVTFGATKEQYKAGDVQNVRVVNADTLNSAKFFRPKTFDVLVTDAPYGVQHGSRGVKGDLSRSPLKLIESALPQWATLVRSGGALGVAWNTYSASREQLAELLTVNGFQVCDGPGYLGFEHRVDQAINRDVIVARKL